jgi:hypothetical protein
MRSLLLALGNLFRLAGFLFAAPGLGLYDLGDRCLAAARRRRKAAQGTPPPPEPPRAA